MLEHCGVVVEQPLLNFPRPKRRVQSPHSLFELLHRTGIRDREGPGEGGLKGSPRRMGLACFLRHTMLDMKQVERNRWLGRAARRLVACPFWRTNLGSSPCPWNYILRRLQRLSQVCLQQVYVKRSGQSGWVTGRALVKERNMRSLWVGQTVRNKRVEKL